MTEKELKKLKRTELLEMLLVQTKRVEELEQELEKKNKQLEDKRIVTEQTGNLADAVLKLNGVFEAAQKAAEQYLYNIKCNTEEKSNKDFNKDFDKGLGENFKEENKGEFQSDSQDDSKEIFQSDKDF
jgi:ClpP class serine protease